MKHKLFWILLLMSSYLGVALSANKGESNEMILELFEVKPSNVESELSREDKVWIKEQVEQFKEIKPYLIDTEKSVPERASLSNTQGIIQSEFQTNTQPNLQIFISFSMPVESLKAWSRQAKKVNGTLVLRGFVENSLKKTLQKILQVFGKDNLTSITVNPIAFKQFDIKAVPAVVVPVSSEKETPFDVVYGDVSLSSALQRIVEEGENVLLAKNYLNLLRDNYE